MKKNLDFICIGAPKAATSTLFELIAGHPQIFIPPAKEVPFFNDDETYQKGWRWYMKTFFSDAKPGQRIGTLTPQYMSGYGINSPERIAERIKNQVPNVKIIMMARHPIERSYSHFKMHQRHGYTKGTFEENAARLLRKKDLSAEYHDLNQTNTFLFASEYGRILEKYYELFGSKNVMLIVTDELERNPRLVLNNIFDFLEVDKDYKPANMHRRTNQGGSKAKIKYLNSAYLHKFPAVKYLWQHLVPPTLRKRIYLKVLFWNTKVDNKTIDPLSSTYKKLVKYYSPDIKKLEQMTGKKLPWSDWK